MSNIAIKVENLSKRYRIGLKEEINDTFVGAITSSIKNPLKNLRQLRRLSAFDENGQTPEDVIWALKDVSFEVEQGEVLGVIGRNGAGKSTLLKILSRITHPTSGRIEMNGRISSLLEVGTGFHPELTGRENIYLNGTILGMRKKEIDRKLDEIIDFSGVEKFIDTPVKRYSSGMRVRLAFSVAAHLEPEILLIDEVLAVGDVEFQKKCLGKMDEVAKGGRTVLFVSHNMGAVKNICSKCMMLENGKIEVIGKTIPVIEKYLNPVGNSDLEVSNFPRKAGSQEVLVQGVKISGGGNRYDGVLVPFSSELEVKIKIVAKTAVRSASMFLLCKTALGDYVLGVFQKDVKQTFNLYEKQELEIKAMVKHNLVPGDYLLDVGVFDERFGFYDWIESVGKFTIVDDKQLRGRLGLVIPETVWELSDNS